MPGPGKAGAELETDRLLLRPWRASEAAIQRELWTERDPRVPAHRRIDAEGRPTVADFEEAIRAAGPPSTVGLLALERKADGDVIGYCGLVEGGPETDGEPHRDRAQGGAPGPRDQRGHVAAALTSARTIRPT